MATKEWKSESVKLDKDTRNAIALICKRDGITVNKLLSDLVARKVEPILNPGVLPENEGIPQIGENIIKYKPQSNTFEWRLDLGVAGTATLSDSLAPGYLEDLRKAIDQAFTQKQSFEKSNKTGFVVPPKLMRFRMHDKH
jgi:hypothetical protein